MEPGLIGDLLLVLLGVAMIALGRLLLTRYGSLLVGMRQLFLLQELARMAVLAAEQVADAQGIPPEERKAYAERMIREALGRLGVRVSEAELDAAIEAAVREMEVLGGQRAPQA